MNPTVPTSIRRIGDPRSPPAIEIVWSDGTTAAYTPRLLRDACPCATCREQRAVKAPPPLLPVLAPAEKGKGKDDSQKPPKIKVG